MSDIIAEINERIAAAENARDDAIQSLKDYKSLISSNGLVVKDGKVFVMVYSGREEYNCGQCPLHVMTSPDQGNCSVHRNCYDKGGRAYTLAELKKDFKRRDKSELEIAMLKENVSGLRRALDIISKTAASATKEGAR